MTRMILIAYCFTIMAPVAVRFYIPTATQRFLTRFTFTRKEFGLLYKQMMSEERQGSLLSLKQSGQINVSENIN